MSAAPLTDADLAASQWFDVRLPLDDEGRPPRPTVCENCGWEVALAELRHRDDPPADGKPGAPSWRRPGPWRSVWWEVAPSYPHTVERCRIARAARARSS